MLKKQDERLIAILKDEKFRDKHFKTLTLTVWLWMALLPMWLFMTIYGFKSGKLSPEMSLLILFVLLTTIATSRRILTRDRMFVELNNK